MKVDPRIADFLKQRIGLDANSIGVSAIERAVRQRTTARGLADGALYWPQLLASGEEQQALIEAVVVPETWFFRYPESFQALTRLVLQLSVTLDRPLRLLSAPCSTGEEPYSIAMALLDTGLAPAQFQVDALDINAQLIERAQAGLYGKNSFRGHALHFREQHFAVNGSDYSLSPRVRAQVRFRAANLMDPDCFSGELPYDFVFCRNVLIYFDLPTQEGVLRTLLRMSRPGGYLFVGPAEANLLSRHGLEALGQPLSFAFRHEFAKPAGVAKARTKAPAAASIKTTTHLPPALHPVKAPRAKPAPALTQPLITPNADRLSTVAALANAGRIAEAMNHCEQELAQSGPSAPLFYWLGLLHDTSGNQVKAEDLYRKALYLEPQHHEALAHLAALLEIRGDAAGARRLQARAARGVNKHG